MLHCFSLHSAESAGWIPILLYLVLTVTFLENMYLTVKNSNFDYFQPRIYIYI